MNTKHWHGLLIATALLGVAGCTDLTVEPKSSVTEANIFSDPNSYRAFLARVYAGLALSGQAGGAGLPDISGIDEGFSQYLRLYWETEELPTDEAVIAWGDIGLPEMNTPLRAQIATYRAEARFLRALSYWHGIDLFGSIPLVTEDNPIGGPLPTQSTRAQIYDFIVSELNDIRSSLPAAGPSSYGRATPAAADMLLAQVYLNAGVYTGTTHYAEALTAASNVVSSGSYSLDPNYQHMFLADNQTSPEIIFAVTQDGKSTQTYGGVTFLVHAACGGNMATDSSGVDYCWWGLRLKPQADSFYVAGDRRASYFHRSGQNVGIASISNFNDGIAAPKFRNLTAAGVRGSDPTFVDTDFPMFRLGEAYLIYAEAQLRGGGGNRTQALNYVNALRVRAYGDSSGVIADPALTLPFILAERGRELLWEAHRRTDLVRYGLFTGGAYLWAWKGGVAVGASLAANLDLYPLPASELIANPNLVQNPGY